MKRSALPVHVLLLFFLPALLSPTAFAEEEKPPPFELELRLPPVIIAGVPFDIQIAVKRLDLPFENRGFTLEILREGKLEFALRGRIIGVLEKVDSGHATTFAQVALEGVEPAEKGVLRGLEVVAQQTSIEGLRVERDGRYSVRLRIEGRKEPVAAAVTFTIYGPLSLLPPIIAIAVALLFRQVVASLLAGIYIGAFFVAGFDPLSALLRTFDHYIFNSLFNSDHMHILIFSVMLGGLVGIISKNGGTRGVVNAIVKVARRRRSGMIATWLLGVAIFFDDYSNTLIVGNTMRPFTDRFRISREKLSYLVDSTAAPVACIAVVSTWVGFEVGLISDAFDKIGEITADPYATFLQTIPYNFYPILALIFGFLVCFWGRDFGPMAKAERRALHEGLLMRRGASPLADYEASAVMPKDGIPFRWFNAAVPILSVIVIVGVGLIYSGLSNHEPGKPITLSSILSNADSFQTLLWASFGGVLVAMAMTIAQRILSLQGCIDAVLGGMRSMMLAVVILTLAWGIGAISEDVSTSRYVVALMGENFPAFLLPALTFVVAAAISFATGTSWGTMSILMPLIIAAAHSLAPGNWTIMISSISGVLAGSVFGDHCSPISDTTVMSSMASACDHIDHVRTQLPYALVVAGVAITVGYIPAALGLNPWLALLAGTVLLAVLLRVLGKPLRSADAGEDFLGPGG